MLQNRRVLLDPDQYYILNVFPPVTLMLQILFWIEILQSYESLTTEIKL